VGYLPGTWRDFGVTVASLAGALTGLLFVAVSIKSEVLARSRSLASRAAQTLVLFMTSAMPDERASPDMVTAVLTGIAGLSFLLKAGGGLYWMIPAVLAGLVGGVINAWLFLIKVPGSSVPG